MEFFDVDAVRRPELNTYATSEQVSSWGGSGNVFRNTTFFDTLPDLSNER
jgi:hypothetical protein